MHEFDFHRLDTGKLTVDHDVQRRLDQRKVEKIAAEYNPDAVGVITVSHRDDGTYHVIDGQHRAAAIRALGDDTVVCRVFHGLSIGEEAAMFRLLNNTNKPQQLDLFRVRVIEGDTVAVAISDILKRHNWSLSTDSVDGCFAAVTAAERVWRLDPEAVEAAVITATRAWGHDRAALDGRVFEGLGLVYARYGEAVDVSAMIDRLARYAGGPGALVGKARGLKDLIGSTVPRAVAEIVVGVYNARRKTRALPDWRSQ